MVPRPLAPARAMSSRTCADVIQPCPLVRSIFALRNETKPKALGSKTSLQGTKILYFSRVERWRRRMIAKFASAGSNDATDILVDLWSEATIQFAL